MFNLGKSNKSNLYKNRTKRSELDEEYLREKIEISR